VIDFIFKILGPFFLKGIGAWLDSIAAKKAVQESYYQFLLEVQKAKLASVKLKKDYRSQYTKINEMRDQINKVKKAQAKKKNG